MFVCTCCYRLAVVGDQKLSLLLHRTTQPSFGTGVCAGGLNPVSAVNHVLNYFQVVCPHHREELIESAVQRVLTYPIAARRWVLCVANGCLCRHVSILRGILIYPPSTRARRTLYSSGTHAVQQWD